MFNIKNKQYAVISAGLMLVISADISVAQNLLEFDVSTSPILKIATPKPNVFIALDDSASMHISGSNHAYMTVKEHFFGPGDPVCEKRTGTLLADWNALVEKYKKIGETEGVKYYNPFQTGSYVPYIISKNGSNGISEIEYDKYIGSIPIERCFSKVYRTEAVIEMAPEIIEKYSKRAYLGYGGFGKQPLPDFKGDYYAETAERKLAKLRKYLFDESEWNYVQAMKIDDSVVEEDVKYNVFLRTIIDMSEYTPAQWSGVKLSIARNIMGQYWSGSTKNFMLGNTPTFNTVYNLSLYFRGYPIVRKGHTFPYGTKEVSLPKRYRCTTNSVIILTDGNSNDQYLGVIAKNDLSGYGGSLPATGLSGATERPEEGTYHFGYNNGYKFNSSSVRKALNKMIGREFTPTSMYDGAYEEKDAAGKGWKSDKFGITQRLQVNAVQYGINNFNTELKDLTNETGGQVITLPEDASSSAIYSAMDTIMSDLIRSTSNAQVAVNQFQKTDNSIRYIFKYNIESRRGEVVAHKADKNSDSGWDELDEKGNPKSLWRSEASILPASGRFITMDYTKSVPKSALIGWDSIKSGYDKGTDKRDLHTNHIGWLRGEDITDDITLTEQKRVYKKLSAMGSIVNSEAALFEYDVEYINLKSMGGDIKREFNDYVLYKNKVLKRDYMVINSNDGMVNFLSIPRSSPNIETELANGTKSVERVTAYFPGILAHRLPKELSGINANGYSIDGVARLFEFKDSKGDFRSIGLSGFGAGGKGLVGYQLFKATPDYGSGDPFKNPDSEIKPLFEISNEENWSKYENNKNFGNLGYTFSDFGFFNQVHPDSTSNGRGVAVFGNGYGKNKSGKSPSSLYFIDVETGAFIKEIILNTDGGGASSPALVVEKSGDYQTLKKIYVGDASGQLYRIIFTSDGFAYDTVEVLYKPIDKKYNPITVKPLVVLDKNDEWVYFGTGRKSDQSLDRGKSSPSKDTQYIVGLKNPKSINNAPLTINELHQNKLTLGDKIEVGSKAKRTVQTVKSTSSGIDIEKIEEGWYIALTKEINSKANTSGERVVFSPKQTYGDVIFSTWGIDEYDASDKDPCVEDYAYGKILILDKKTGALGTGTIEDKKVGGFVVDEYTPGMPAGHGIMNGRTTGEFSGRSTLDKATIETLNKAADSSHKPAEKKVCTADVSDDLPNVYNFTVMCPPGKTLSGRKVSVRKRM